MAVLPSNPTQFEVVNAVNNLLTFSTIATTLGLTTAQLTELVELARVTTVETSSVTIAANMTATTFNAE